MQTAKKLSPRANDDKGFRIAFALTGIFGAAGVIFFSLSHSGNPTFALLLAVLAALLTETLCWKLFLHPNSAMNMTVFGPGNKGTLGKIALASLLVGILLEFGTLAGYLTKSPFSISDWSIRRLLIFALTTFFCFILIAYFKQPCSEISLNCLARPINRIKQNPSSYAKKMGLVAICFAASLVVAFLLRTTKSLSLSMQFSFLFLLCLALIAVFACGDKTSYQPQKAFLAISLTAGIAFIIAFPATHLYSWDDQIHFKRSLDLSFIEDTEITSSDSMLINFFRQDLGFSSDAGLGKQAVDYSATWSHSDIVRLARELDANRTAATATIQHGITETTASYSALSYLPLAAGLWLGRLAHLPFSLTFMLARLFNLLFYTCVIYKAIEVIPVKKYFLSALALAPSCVFMAANFSYDTWLLSLLLLAFALYIRERFKEGPIEKRTIALICLVLFLALSPKPVYCPLIGIMLLLPRKKFNSSVDSRRYRIFLVCLGLLAMLSFAAPFLASGASSATDLRGGNDVNSAKQLAFLLDDPLHYAKVLIFYFANVFFAPWYLNQSLINLAYLSNPADIFPLLNGLPLLFLFFVCVTDANQQSQSLIKRTTRVWASFVIFLTAVLVCTALYIGFTPVGSDGISGVQARYLLPILFPAGICLFNFRICNQVSVVQYGRQVCFCSSLLLFVTMWLMLYSRIAI